MIETQARRCVHCERLPAEPASALCARCYAVRRIRYLYRLRSQDPTDPVVRFARQNEELLRERARRGLPLFPSESRS
jgi:hypothetical protein